MVPSLVRLRGHDSSEGWPGVGWEGEGAFLVIHEQFLFLSFDRLLDPSLLGSATHTGLSTQKLPLPCRAGCGEPCVAFFQGFQASGHHLSG